MDPDPLLESSVWPPPPSYAVEAEDAFLTTFSLFRVQSAWMILLLTIITVGIYPVVWLRRQTVILNLVQPDRSVTMTYSGIVLASTILSAVLDIASAVGDSHLLDQASNGLDRIVAIMILVLTFQVRNRFNVLFQAQKGDANWFSGVFTWLLSVIYLQHKLNTNILRHRSAAG